MSGPGPTSYTIEEMEAAQLSGQEKPPVLAEVKLEGEEIPADLRGKTAADVIAQVKSLGEALRISEQARLAMEASLRAVPQQAPQQPPPMVEEPKELTDEELKQLHDEDPLKAIRIMNEQAIKRAEKNLETRLGPLLAGSNQSAEEHARSKYADEFELFGDQIQGIVASLPNAKAVLTNPQAWDDMIALVRGRPGNMEKLFERKVAQKQKPTIEAARQEQAESVGFSATEPRNNPIPRTSAQLDPIQREIADKLGMTPDEYVRWSHVG